MSIQEYVRPQAAELRRRLEEPRRFIQVVAGPRQVGKTTLVTHVADTVGLRHVFASADEPTLRGYEWIETQWEAARLRLRDRDAQGALLVLDEVFGSLDEERRAAVVDLLRSLADRFPQVILITHIGSVREGFDRVVRVELDSKNGIASIRDEAPGVSDGLAA